MLKIQIIIGSLSLLILTIIFELIRRGKLKEEYSLLWLLSGTTVLLFSIFPRLLYVISHAMGMYYLTTLFVISFLFLLLIVLHFSTVISELSKKNKELAQNLSIVDHQLRQLDEKFYELAAEKELSRTT